MSGSAERDYLSFGTKINTLRTLTDWNAHNSKVLKGDIIKITADNASITKNSIEKVNQTSNKNFDEATSQLNHRARHINFWKAELERSIREINEEIIILERQRQQLKNAMDTLKIPEYITEECLDIRTNRLESDLIFDEVQQQLFVEQSLIDRVKKLHNELLIETENQMDVNLNIKKDLEHDWSNKSIAFKLENNNIDLAVKSTNIMETSGATRLSEGQSNVELWEENSVNTVTKFQNALANSKNLRAKTEATLINTARDLRTQDILVNKVLCERIAQTTQVKIDLENQLKLTLKNIAESENLMDYLHDEILAIKQRLQVAQTRLNTKNTRPNIENCREGSLISLLEEVRDLNDSLTILKNRYKTTQDLKIELIQERSRIENEIIVKNKSLHVDNERCLFIRSHYQSAEKMCGL